MSISTPLDLVHSWANAEQDNDAKALDELLAADFVGVGPVGFVLDRSAWLVRFDNGLHNESFAVEDVQTHDHGDAVFIVGVLNQDTTHRGESNSGRFRLTLLAVRTDDGWRLASVRIGTLTIPGPPAG